MTTTLLMASLIVSFLLILYSTTIVVASSESRCRRYKSIISFGDSIADTGNYLRLSNVKNLPQAAFLPYGESFFHPPSGRYSDGRLIIDFIVEFLGLPYVPPYFGSQNVSFNQGINFAVYGATALDRAFLVKQGIKSDFTNISLSVQLNTFKKILPNLCASSTRDCREMLGDSLILMGEIGGNDYNYPFFEGKSINEIKELVPLIIKAISSAIMDLIDLGGKTFLVPGNFPIGCSAAYLTLFQTATVEHDPFTGCIPWLNKFGELHNEQLKIELKQLQKLYPHVNIIYADYYNSLYWFFQEPAKYGFKNRPLAACCGVGGQYNFTIGKECGENGVSYCQNPSEYVNWDGYHLTEATYQKMAQGLLNGPYTTPAFDWSCLGSYDSVDKDDKLVVAPVFARKKKRKYGRIAENWKESWINLDVGNINRSSASVIPAPTLEIISIFPTSIIFLNPHFFLMAKASSILPPVVTRMAVSSSTSLGLPNVPYYFGSQNVSFDQGINFAVYGATALDRAFLVEKGIESDFTNVSLNVQLNIFKQILPNLCTSSSRDCREMLGDSLILMGEIGVNDYNYPFFEGKSINEIKELVPLVIKAISSAIVDLIDLWGNTFLVPGNFPLGCYPAYLTLFQTAEEEDYDPFTGCLRWLNEFGEHHNEQLKTELKRLQELYDHVNISYADYYNSLFRLYQEPVKYGFKNRPLAACCGIGGQYNFTINEECGHREVSYCQNPSEYVNWDGYHLTEATHQKMAQVLLNGPMQHLLSTGPALVLDQWIKSILSAVKIRGW
ncbi:unnamed protein product [Arabidopsis arenosa]|uniref:Uncharacterized protein n=1 Tax=Arabidopsis arenosa TaxID=38785 RepID=A0A8S1ZN26_ARAAE|nr:unnamed protein product [Arabidopsis arenosa]